MVFQDTIEIRTNGRGTVDLTRQVADMVAKSGCRTGICQVFVHHTSASLMLCENADPDVRRDLETFMTRLVPDGDAMFRHGAEGADDMPAHVRTVLTNPDLTVPVRDGCPALGTWQGIYLWEHRARSHGRRVSVTIYGE